ncbi:MAG: hypothetical protein M3P49_13710 [Actinomycetota bacterium]|nr:hypothetical protein [Actinomycetota bacterium]
MTATMQTHKPRERRGGQLNILIEPSLLRRLKYAALDDGTTVTSLLTTLIKDHLRDRESKGRGES